MTDYQAVALAKGFEEGTNEDMVLAWQHLVDSGLAWNLHDWFGRTAAVLIKRGVIHGKRLEVL